MLRTSRFGWLDPAGTGLLLILGTSSHDSRRESEDGVDEERVAKQEERSYPPMTTTLTPE